MAAIWWLASAIASTISILALFFTPVINFHINKKLSKIYECDASEKFRKLADSIPLLKFALKEVEEQWILKKLSPLQSDAFFRLDQLASLLKDLKTALYEAEDIVDDINYHRLDDTTYLQRFWRCLCDPIREGFALVLVQLMRESQPRSDGILPSYHASPSFFHRATRSVSNWLAKAYEFAKYQRDMSNTNAAFKTDEQDTACNIPRPLYNRLQKNMEGVDQLFCEGGKYNSFKKKVQETVKQTSQGRNDGSGNTRNVTNKGEHVTAYPAKVIGRENVREQIRTMLHDISSDENAIGIWGIPGSGKTTLAQYVYQCEKGGSHFDLVMWIHVSEIFSVYTIFKQIFEAASPNGDGKNVCPEYNSIEVLRTELVIKLEKKRLLLVLDDIWDSNFGNGNSLSEVSSLLIVGRKGSKILVTSRDESALGALGPVVRFKKIAIPPLDEKDCFELLMYYARVDTKEKGPLHTIGEKIAQKLNGSPLIAVLVGGILSKDYEVDYWRTILYQKHLNETPGADIWWCYQHLDENVRRCFAFCSIFPRGHHLFRDELVNLWVAEGFITSTNEGEEMEDVGQRYFLQLVSTLFLQPGIKANKTDASHYQVHDLLHELAVEVAGSDCSRIENSLRLIGNKLSSSWDGEVPPDVRHLFVQNYNAEVVTEKILQLENLRTLIIYAVPVEYDTTDAKAVSVKYSVFNKRLGTSIIAESAVNPISEKRESVSVEYEVIKRIFHMLRKLRVLAIGFTHGVELIKKPVSVPESVCQSKHLRYLAFRTVWGSKVTFPSTPTKLYHMHLLDVGDAEYLDSYGDFTNLRHVLGNKILKVRNMGKMTSLQRMQCFIVCKEQGYEIKQLRDLNKLRGSLSVSGLANVTSKAEALEAKLAGKKWLRRLSLEWGSVDPLEFEADVLEGLCPPIGLETLYICFYNGSRYPNWMLGKENGGPLNLIKLGFLQCSHSRAPELKAFIHLQTLKVTCCSWNALPGNMEDLTSLKVLFIENCWRIHSIPTLPLSIEEFTLSLCEPGFMRSCEDKENLNWQNIKHIPKKNIIFSTETIRNCVPIGSELSYYEVDMGGESKHSSSTFDNTYDSEWDLHPWR